VKSIYIDWVGIDNGADVAAKQAVDAGYNLVILAFLVSGVQYDAAQNWAQLTAARRSSALTYIHNAGARIIVSTGGATDTQFYTWSASSYGAYAANFANTYSLDGVDFDLENFGGGFTIGSMNSAQTIQWVADATNAARSILGANKIITHAPQPPYFGANNGFSNAYPQIYAKAPTINFLQVQFYNNGPSSTYQTVFVSNNGQSVLEISQQGIPLNKIVVGKPVASGDGNPVDPASTIHSIVSQAGGIGWYTGVMGWMWHDPTTNANWIHTIYP